MKKIMISLLMVAAAMNVMATETAFVRLKVTAQESNKTFTLTLIENDEVAPDVAGPNSLEVNWEGREMGFYVTFAGKEYQVFEAKDLHDIDLELKADASTSYKVDVLAATGKTIYFQDGTGTPMALEAGQNFTIAIDASMAGARIPNRFSFDNELPVVPGEPKICFVNKHLIVENATVDIQVLNEDKTLYMEYPATSTDIDLSGAPVNPSPYYWVVFEGDEMKINLNPTLE